MKKLSLILAVLFLFAFTLGAQTEAQMQPQPQIQPVPPPVAGSPMAQGAQPYNPATVQVVSGQVTAVNAKAHKKEGRDAQMKLVLRTEQGTINVNVGPAGYVAQQNFSFAIGDQVQVKGSVIQRPRTLVIIAEEITKGGQVLRLRDESGRPLWRGMRQPGR